MTLAATEDGIATRILEADASNKVLLAAARASNAVGLRADADHEEEELLGIIVGGSETQIEVEISPLDHYAHAILASPVLFASLDVADRRYVFKTHCVTITVESETDVLRLVRPTAIAVVERRRSRRRAFREPTRLVLRTTDPDAGWRLQAEMLNLSLSGVACRIREEDAAGAMKAGQTIHVAFNLGKPAQAFDLTARVITRTGAGTPGHIVVGLEFVEDGCLEATRKRLRVMLAQTG
ncbi:MAG: PilZ domain-containing protein [Planctomycetota bacterium]|jgi:hypothetical protein